MINKAQAVTNVLGLAAFETSTLLMVVENNIERELTVEELALVNIEYERLIAEETATKYQRDRALAYPSIQEQLDMQYWDSVNGTTTWADAIAKVKADYPKGAE